MPFASLLRAVLTEDWRQGGFGLYIHWPFCEAKCPYCDFNSHVARTIDQGAWRAAYLKELSRVAAETKDRVLNTVFFGGGTPSLMAPDTTSVVIEAIRSHWATANDLEITLEANPGSVEAGRFSAFRDAGVNRISMGVQALNDIDLRRLGRIHSVTQARQAFDIARDCFDRVSFDLIYARQDQGLSDWESELKEAMSMAVDHLSLYQLTVEPGTAFGDRYNAGKLRGLPRDDLAADMYQLTQDLCLAHGFPRYEVSNHARDGAESRHNLIYWRAGDYVGIGPGAHGRVTLGGVRYATDTLRNPNDWLTSVARKGGEKDRTALSREECGEEYIMMGLRISQGIDLKRYSEISAREISDQKLSHLCDIGVLHDDGIRVKATDQGMMVLNSVIAELLAD